MVQVSGCDVEILPSPTPKIEAHYVLWGKQTGHDYDYWPGDLGPGHPNIKVVRIMNPTGCSETVERRCADLCTLKLFAPPDTYGFIIEQVRANPQDPPPPAPLAVEGVPRPTD